MITSLLYFSSQKQEVDANEGSVDIERADVSSAHWSCVLSGAEGHAPACANHAIPAQSHWARDHLRRLRQHRPGHVYPSHDHTQPPRWPPSRLGRQVGQSPSRWALVPNTLLSRCTEFISSKPNWDFTLTSVVVKALGKDGELLTLCSWVKNAMGVKS